MDMVARRRVAGFGRIIMRMCSAGRMLICRRGLRTCVECPNVSVILAHIGRSYGPWFIEQATIGFASFGHNTTWPRWTTLRLSKWSERRTLGNSFVQNHLLHRVPLREPPMHLLAQEASPCSQSLETGRALRLTFVYGTKRSETSQWVRLTRGQVEDLLRNAALSSSGLWRRCRGGGEYGASKPRSVPIGLTLEPTGACRPDRGPR